VIRITGFSFFLVTDLFTVAFVAFLVFDIGSYSSAKMFCFFRLAKTIYLKMFFENQNI